LSIVCNTRIDRWDVQFLRALRRIGYTQQTSYPITATDTMPWCCSPESLCTPIPCRKAILSQMKVLKTHFNHSRSLRSSSDKTYLKAKVVNCCLFLQSLTLPNDFPESSFLEVDDRAVILCVKQYLTAVEIHFTSDISIIRVWIYCIQFT
jgi:hypothetical protein